MELTFVKGLDYRYDDDDLLAVSYPYDGFEDLSHKLAMIGIPLSLRSAEAEHWPPPIKAHPAYSQPMFLELFGCQVHVLVAASCINIAVRGERRGRLSQRQLEVAKPLDTALAKVGLSRKERPLTMGDFIRAEVASES
ncbi:MAG TPA: hypothetical protein VNV16_03470 [Methylibium sp.]|nr:hypothetical protein [Methylibium sp.]